MRVNSVSGPGSVDIITATPRIVVTQYKITKLHMADYEFSRQYSYKSYSTYCVDTDSIWSCSYRLSLS
jgi:hypothetical protein